MITKYLRENGYEGVIPEVLLTDEAHSFTVDSKDKTTGAKRREKIYFSINDIADPDLAFSKLFGHEKAHKFKINNGELYQVEGSLNGVDGRFEWIIQDGEVTHRMFVEGGVINGKPIDPLPSLSTDFYLNLKP